MARALQAARVEKVADAKGTQHAWRTELVDALVQRQREDGSWRNSVERWEESNEQLATIYAVLALEEAIKPMNASSK
jgi:squalene-hopene/tetraprenyl-beta-curcumene cyclase